MTFNEIISRLKNQFGDSIIVELKEDGLMPYVVIPKVELLNLSSFLQSDEMLFFDMLSSITAIDLGKASTEMELVYNFYSIPFEHSFCFKIKFDKETDFLPKVDSLSSFWNTANWHEREAFDLFGINFVGHPDLRRILLPEDWQGYPLRKDYQEQEKYHGITVKYEKE